MRVSIVQSEMAVIVAGVVAGQVHLRISEVAAAACCALTGDNAAHALGDVFGRRAVRRLVGSMRRNRRIAWAHRLLHRRGGIVIVVARFIPGGRAATTLTAWMVELRFLFACYDAIAACGWARFACPFCGQMFRRSER